jgi:hypothetical protein
MKSRNLLILLLFILLTGCSVNDYNKFYTQSAPFKYKKTINPQLFSYNNADLDELYKKYYSDYIIIGKSLFNGVYRNPKDSLFVARKIGADVVLTTSKYISSQTSYVPLTTTTAYSSTTTILPVTHQRYDQAGIFLKKMSAGSPLWQKTSTDYQRNGKSLYDGNWINEFYKIEAYTSAEKVVGVITEKPKKRVGWDIGDVKFVFNKKNGEGLYFYENRTPSISLFSINQFGHLVSDDGSPTSFMRQTTAQGF